MFKLLTIIAIISSLINMMIRLYMEEFDVALMAFCIAFLSGVIYYLAGNKTKRI